MTFSSAIFASAALAAAPMQTYATSSAFGFDSAPSQPAGYERVAKVLIGEKLCRVFGYSVDVEGLANWANGQAALIAEQDESTDRKTANVRLTRAIRSEFMFVQDRYWAGFEFASASRFYNSRRFQMRYRKKCEALANSPDAGAFFEKTSEEQDYLAMVENVRDNFMRIVIPGPARPGKRTPIDVRLPRN